MDIRQFASGYISELVSLLDVFPKDRFEDSVETLLDAYENEKNILIMGNGGSASTASHLACDINKGCSMDLDKKFKVYCLNDNVATMLALANDVSYDSVFAEQMKSFYSPGDVVIGISGSGNSQNVLNAISLANENRGITIGLSGFSGGKLDSLARISLVAEIQDMQKVEDVHMIVVHMLMQALYAALHDGGRPC